MDENRTAGEVRRQAGKVQGVTGGLTGDARTQTRGRTNEAEGTAENLYGQARDAVRDVADSASELWDGVYEQGGQLYRQGSRAVSNVDLTGVLIGLAAGYALGWIIHSEHSYWRDEADADHRDADRGYVRPGSRNYRSGSGRGYR